MVGAAISAAAGQREDRFAEQRLFKPLGMRDYHWTGVDQTGSGWGAGGLRLRAVDMAKLGQLVLDGGRWQGRQIVPEAWLRQMTSPSSAPFYGYYWWINNVVEGRPEVDVMGFKGQFITVLPAQRAVVVMTSMLPIEGGLQTAKNVQLFRQMLEDYILPALDGGAAPSEAAREALLDELELSRRSQGVAGVEADPTDTPRI